MPQIDNRFHSRIFELDFLRGIAIVLMVAYHIIFDLYYFQIFEIDLYAPALVLFQHLIGFMFILLVGISLAVSEARTLAKAKLGGGESWFSRYFHHFKRGLKLAAVALLITAATWVYPHDGFITFGIIHLIALSTFVAPFFFKFGRANVALGLLLLALGFCVLGFGFCVSEPVLGLLASSGSCLCYQPPAGSSDGGLFFWLWNICPGSGYDALDYYPFVPWFGAVLLGVYAGQKLFPGGQRSSFFQVEECGFTRFLSFLGKNSLLIYLLHQVVLVGLILLALQMGGIGARLMLH